jgi:tRNA (guanine37-N1)-methyltransferase
MAYGCEILTLFPGMIHGYAGQSILGKALERGLVHLQVTDIREFAAGRHRVTDDAPYGGGAGMVMKVEPLAGAIAAARVRRPEAPVVLLSPRGPVFTQARARVYRDRGAVILVCGRYEGVDERARALVDEELSVGDYVLTGGELGALIVLDAVARLVPGVLGNAESPLSESFEAGLLEHPQYTRPPAWNGQEVPAVLQGGDHARIARWRRWHALQETRARRPELFGMLQLSREDRALLELDEAEL